MKKRLPLIVFLLTIISFESMQVLAQIPNPSFENWTAGEPDGWHTGNVGPRISVAQSPSAHTGSSSLRLQVYDEFGSMACGGLRPEKNIALTGVPVALRGWYQFHPTADERVQIEGYVTDPPFNGALFYSPNLFSPASSWTPFSLVFDYAYPPTSPDTLSFYFLMYCSSESTLDTYLLLDDLNLEAAVGVEGASPDHLKTTAYPNPASDEIYIGFEAIQRGKVSIKIIDLAGRVVMERETKTVNTGWAAERFDTRGLAAGIYIAWVKAGDHEARLRIQIAPSEE